MLIHKEFGFGNDNQFQHAAAEGIFLAGAARWPARDDAELGKVQEGAEGV
jgi:hypothetical protein